MNKKVSTLLTASLLMMSPVFGSIFAQTQIPVSDVENGATYVVKATKYWNNTTDGWQNHVNPYYLSIDNEGNVSFEIHTNYTDEGVDIWTVSKGGPANNIYKFTSSNGQTFTIADATGAVSSSEFVSSTVSTNDLSGNLTNSSTLEWFTADGTKYMVGHQNGGEKVLAIACDGSVDLASGDQVDAFELIKIEDESVTDGLNDLYNEKGFNLDVKGDLADVAVDGNLFNEEGSTIWAFYLKTDYAVRTDASNGKELKFPAGTYFFTDRVLNDNYKSGTIDKEDIDWLNSTFIAISSTEVGEATDAERQAGQGFMLTKVKGEDFVYPEQNPSDAEGLNIAVNNACFSVQTNHSAATPYALAVENFYYQASAKNEETAAQKTKGVYLGVISYNETTQNVASVPADNTPAINEAEHIFSFVESNVQDGRLLLNEDKTPAVYTIKFIDGNDVADLEGKYLTVGTESGSSFRWEAKGGAIADATYPEFQFVITDVEKAKSSDKIYSLVTFTNRETGKDFTAKLYPTGDADQYTLSLPTPSELETIYPFTVNRNTYAANEQDPVDFDTDIVVELDKVTPDNYAGFLNVADKTIRTIAFARDVNVTSNRLYAAVTNDHKLNAADEFATEIYDAAQWQLVKSEKPKYITRVFVYNNTTDESVDLVSKGDSVCAYTYKLRYVVDGSETNYYLDNATKTLEECDKVEDANDFIIKMNADGSVSIFNAEYDAFTNKQVAKENKRVAFNVALNSSEYDYVISNTNRKLIYQSESAASDIKTYLDPEHAEISWPAEEGHVTIQSELGNYISLNDERDGISVNEEEAVPFYLHVTDKDAVVPSFYISEGMGEGSNAESERMFLFNPVDSVDYYVTEQGDYDKVYMARENVVKAIAKAGTLNESRDTITIKVKGEADKLIAEEADNNDKNIWGGLNRFKFQIVETEEGDGLYYIRQTKAGLADGEEYNTQTDPESFGTKYLYVINNKLGWGDRGLAEKFAIKGIEAPTANEGVSATEVKVIAVDGAINIKNAAGKNVVVSTILGQIVANEVLTSDNATISVPAGIAIVSVDGEEAVKVSVK